MDEFTHVNETNFSRLDPIEINSDTPIIPHELYERHYGNYQENEEVEIDEDEEVDLDDTPTSSDLNSTKFHLRRTILRLELVLLLLFQLGVRPR
ncbi:hypothetical protein H5410_040070 [Solanum commersonii]|uniref:Uncharacterized protein n=1 Tax=Solanum commersonii TaxID=4109 RepID=A0A9J5XQB3_SOLCO|nr:hypothetical protein H5410_040070 [Solanum commersonii]